jgi:transposase
MTNKEKQHLVKILDMKVTSCQNFLNRNDSGKYCVRRETATKQAIALDLATILAEMSVITWDRCVSRKIKRGNQLMQMTENEIKRRYKDASNKTEIIQILADLNACPTANIKKIVEDIKTPVSYQMSKDERIELYMMLYKQGKTDKEISEAGGVSVQAIWQWRKNNKLSDNKIKKEKKKVKATIKKETVPEAIKPDVDYCDTEQIIVMAERKRPEADEVLKVINELGFHPGLTDSTEQLEKPPLGLRPNFIWMEERLTEILEATNRYVEAKKDIPFEWIKEYIEILIELDNRETA